MADNPPPLKPKPAHLSHLHSEPVPMSFASPQFLENLAAGNISLFHNSPMKTTNQSAMMPATAGYSNNHTTQTMKSVQPSMSAASAVVSASASSGSNVIKPLPAQPVDANTFLGFKFVTLDGLQQETREVYDKISGTFQWNMWENQSDQCIKFIRDDCKDKRVFLITSGGLGQNVVPEIHDLPQLYAIYIYCANVSFHREWSKKYTKVRVVCDNDDLYLLPQFAVDVAQANIDWGNGYLKIDARDKAKAKFTMAFEKLNNYARNHDQAMDVEIKNKLEECK